MASASSSSSSVVYMEVAEEQSVFVHISDDALLAILRHISTRELLTSAAVVCRRWRRLVKDYDLVYELVPNPCNSRDRPWGSVGEDQLLQIAQLHSSSLERVLFHGCRRLTSSDGIVALLPTLRKLKELAVVSCPLTSSDLEAIASNLPGQLVHLDLHTDHFGRNHCDVCNASSSGTIEDSVINTLSEKSSQLRRLNLDACSNYSMRSLGRLLGANELLTSVDLHSHALGWPDVAKVFEICKSLQHFSLVSPLLAQTLDILEDRNEGNPRRQIRRRGSEHMASHTVKLELPTSLISLRLYSSPHRSIPLELVSPVMGLLRESGMQILHLHAQGVFSTTWQAIYTWCPNLKLLDLSQYKHETGNLTTIEGLVLCALIKMLKNLEYLALPAATDTVLRHIGDHCSKLREVRLEGFGQSTNTKFNMNVTDLGVVSLVEGCPDLRVLSLAGCRRISIRSARAIAFHCRRLSTLILSHCRGIKDDSISTMLPRLSSCLEYLDLVGCKISLVSVQAILQYANVTTLKVVAVRIPPYSSTAWNDERDLRLRIKNCRVSHPRWDGFYDVVAVD